MKILFWWWKKGNESLEDIFAWIRVTLWGAEPTVYESVVLSIFSVDIGPEEFVLVVDLAIFD